MSSHPDIRRELAVAALGEHHQQKIREGMPEIGWDGDPWLTLCYNKLEDRLEVWQEDPGREPVCVMRSKPLVQGAPSIIELCMHLRDHDLRKIATSTIEARIDQENEENQARVAAEHFDQQVEAMQKVYWAVGRDTDNYKPVIGIG